MVGKITVAPVALCVDRIKVMISGGKNINITTKLYKFRQEFHKNTTLMLFSMLLAALLFVLYITNQKPAYTHTNVIYDEHSIHDKPDSEMSYGVVIDCGSSGSRVYIMYWPPHTGSKTELLQIKQMIDMDGNPVRKKIKPGISSYAKDPGAASESLRPLLEFAGHHVPRRKHQETPLYILATAGMRLLPKHKQHAVLNNLRKKVPKMTKFYVADSHIEVITGKQEGIYLWIATNYALGRFDHTHDPTNTSEHKRRSTVGTIEIGGASLQIAYEVPWDQYVPLDYSATINLGCDIHETIHEYKVYVVTHLGYGTDAARRRYIEDIYNSKHVKLKNHEKVTDACLPPDMVDDVSIHNATYKLTGTGEFSRCKTLLRSILNESTPCSRSPCSLNGVFQPAIDFNAAEFYGFAEFWYSSNDVLRMGERYRHKLHDAASKDFCQRSWSLHKHHYKMGLYPHADAFRFKYQCFKSAWMTTVLHKGLRFPDNYRNLKAVQTINGKEVQWAMGALLYRTRFFPMRDMKTEDSLSTKAQQHIFWLVFHNGFYPIVIVLTVIVVLMLWLYYRRINRYSKTINIYRDVDDLDQVPPDEVYVYDLRVDM